jgi:hypothetical protein
MTIVRTSLHTIESARRVRFEPTGTVAATDVQRAIEEVRADLDTAAEIAFTPAGNIAATNVQAAIEELDTEKVNVTDLTGWRTVSTATDTVLPTDRQLWVTANPCTLTWPLSSAMTFDVRVQDGLGTAGDGVGGANNIHNVFTGGETCSGLADVKVTSNFGFVVIGKRPVGAGYVKKG